MGTAPSSINEYLNFLFFFIFLWLFTLSYLVGNYVTWYSIFPVLSTFCIVSLYFEMVVKLSYGGKRLQLWKTVCERKTFEEN